MAYCGKINTEILSDETFDLLCRVCKRKDKHTEAEKYCVECQDYYCLTCVKVHEDIPSLTGHRILGKCQFPSGSVKSRPGRSKTVPEHLTERCDRHSHNCIDMYCQNHDVVGCGTCMAVDHRLCQDIFYIPEFLQNNISTITTMEVQIKLEIVSKTQTKHHEILKREKQKMMKRKATILESIKRFRKAINERLDVLEKNTVANNEDQYNALLLELEEDMKLLETNILNVTAVQQKLESGGKISSQTFVNIKQGENIADKAANIVEKGKSQIPSTDVDFNADSKITSLLEEINSLGEITVRNMEITNVQNKDTLLQTKGSKKTCIKIQSDVEICHIVSACTLDDGTILLSDCSNKNLKRLDSSACTVIDYCDLPGEPWQVCSINKQQAAVCIWYQREVHFISLTNKMTLTNKITTDFQCYGLAYTDGNLYISDDSTSVYLYSVSGRKLKQFNKDMSGQKVFSFTCCLAVSKDGSKIYVSDLVNGLFILDKKGKVVGQFNGQQLDGACETYLTGRGSLLVCGKNSNNVLQFGMNVELIGEVVKFGDDSPFPQAVCCNEQMSKMIIGKEEENEIEVFDLV